MVANYVAAYEATIEATRARDAPLAVRPRDRLGSRCPRWARSPRSRSTSSSTRRSSATSAARSSPRSGSPSRSSAARSRSSTSSSTGRPRRWRAPAGRASEETARRLGAQAVWLSLAFGFAVSALVAVLAPAARLADGRRGADGRLRRRVPPHRGARLPGRVPRARRAGLPARASPTCVRRSSILIAGNVANLVLELLFVYGFDWGIAGLGVGDGDRAARDGRRVRRRRCSAHSSAGEAAVRLALARRVLSLGKWIFIRTTALMLSFVLAGAVATRFGDAVDRRAPGRLPALDLPRARARLGRDRRADHRRPRARRRAARSEAYGASERMIWLSVALGGVFAACMLVLAGVLPRAFTERRVGARPGRAPVADLRAHAAAERSRVRARRDPHRRERRPFLAVLDGRRVRVACAVVLLAALAADWGIRGVWAALLVLILVRLTLMTTRFRRGRWLVTGWA